MSGRLLIASALLTTGVSVSSTCTRASTHPCGSRYRGLSAATNSTPDSINLAMNTMNTRLRESPPSLAITSLCFDCCSVTGRRVGSLKFHSLFPDGGYFFHREQTLRLHVLNAIG